MWNFGSLLGACLIIQILTGVFLAMHYTPSYDLAFASVEHIMRDVSYGWAIRYFHANTASFFFIFVYFHTARGLYYGSYKSPRTLPWSIGVVMLILMMAIAFLGYTVSQTWWFTCFSLLLMGHTHSRPVDPSSCSERCARLLNNRNLRPVAVFENLHVPGVKAKVTAFLKPLAGVYLILNLVTGMTYVGSAITGQMGIRFHKHLYGAQGNKNVAEAVEAHGLEKFAFVVLETVPQVVTQQDNDELLAIEDLYFELVHPEYNEAPHAGNTFGYKHTEETKLKMRVNYSDERREAIGALNRGKKLSEEQKELLRIIAKQRPPMSEEARAKVSANSTVANLYDVSPIDPNQPMESVTLRTVATVAKHCNCGPKTVDRALKGSGIIKKTWRVTLLGKANASKSS